MKNVTFFTNGLVGVGGAERVLLEASSYFKKKKINVTIVTFSLDKNALMDYNSKFRIINIKTNNYANRIIRLRKVLKKLNPGIIVGQSSLDCMYLYLSTLFTKFKYLSYIHGSLFWLENDYLKYSLIHKSVFNKIRNSLIGHKQFVPQKSPLNIFNQLFFNLVAAIEYFGVRKSQKIIVLTKQIKWEVKKLYNKDSIIVRGCIDKSLLNYKPKISIKEKYNMKNKKIILNIGRLDPRKRIDVLIKSFFKICEKHNDVVLMIGGKGPDQGRLDKIINNPKFKKYKHKVIMLGFIPDNEYFDYLAGCDLFAFPSWTTSGIPTYEALALGKKVVWTSEAEEPILNHKNVFVANPNVNDFSEAIHKALISKVVKKPNLREHTWDNYFEKLFMLSKKATTD
jgi:glycosyltransferase involved in cell wall biosynthesis